MKRHPDRVFDRRCSFWLSGFSLTLKQDLCTCNTVAWICVIGKTLAPRRTLRVIFLRAFVAVHKHSENAMPYGVL